MSDCLVKVINVKKFIGMRFLTDSTAVSAQKKNNNCNKHSIGAQDLVVFNIKHEFHMRSKIVSDFKHEIRKRSKIVFDFKHDFLKWSKIVSDNQATSYQKTNKQTKTQGVLVYSNVLFEHPTVEYKKAEGQSG